MILAAVAMMLGGGEIALWLVGFVPDYDPADAAAFDVTQVAPAGWWRCDEIGCRFDAARLEADFASRDELDTRFGPLYVAGRLKHINNMGFYDEDEFAPSDDEDAYRILFLGDSFTFGIGADIGQGYAEIVEQKLAEQTDVLIWNAAIPATSTRQAAALLDELGPILQPDLVIYGFVGNDYTENLYPLDAVFVTEHNLWIFQYRLDHEFEPHRLTPVSAYRRAVGRVPYQFAGPLERLVRRTRMGSLIYTGGYVAFRRLSGPVDHLTGRDNRRWLREQEQTAELMTQLRDEAAAQDAALLVLLAGRIDPDLEQVKLLDDLGIMYLDPSGGIDPVADFRPPPDAHWNNAGHALAADALLECISPAVVSHQPFVGCP